MPQKTPANSSRRATTESIVEECERLRERNQKLEQQLSKHDDKFDAKSRELRAAKEEIKRLQGDLDRITIDRDTYEKAYKQKCHELRNTTHDMEMTAHENKKLRASYENLKAKYEAIPEDRKNPLKAMPERPKRMAGNASATSGGSGTSSRAQEEAERGRMLEKARLGARFDTTKRPPPTSGNRNSFIEGYGPRRRSGSAAPSSRSRFDDVARTGRHEEPKFSTRDPVTYSAVPRTVVSNNSYRSGDSSGLGDEYEDGDYHLYPC